jgi:hypothetical protein
MKYTKEQIEEEMREEAAEKIDAALRKAYKTAIQGHINKKVRATCRKALAALADSARGSYQESMLSEDAKWSGSGLRGAALLARATQAGLTLATGLVTTGGIERRRLLVAVPGMHRDQASDWPGYHVTRVEEDDVFGHAESGCDPAGCSGYEIRIGSSCVWADVHTQEIVTAVWVW